MEHGKATLVDEETKHLLSPNYWLLPIYQELLHAASSHNASKEGERKRPRSGLVKVIAHQREYPGRGRDDHTARVSDCIGGHCPADTLMAWFPAHWLPLVLKGLEVQGARFRQRHPQWFDSKCLTTYTASNRMPFKVDDFGLSSDQPVPILTASLRIDWLTHRLSQLAEGYVRQLPNLRWGVIQGIFQVKAALCWGGNRPEGIQVSTCLPNDRDLDTWYDAVYALPISWPDISDLGVKYQHRAGRDDLTRLRNELGMDSMWDRIQPKWRTLDHNLYNRGPHVLSPQVLEERLFLNQSSRPGDEVMDQFCRASDWRRKDAWVYAKREAAALCRNRPPLQFTLTVPIVDIVLDICHRGSQGIQLQYRQSHDRHEHHNERDSKRRRK